MSNRPRATKQPSKTGFGTFRTIRCCRSSRATAPARHLARRCAVFDAAVEKAYEGKKKIAWFEVFAGEKAFNKFNNWLPDDTVEAFKEYLVGIKGPLTTPVGGGIRSLNVALRQMLDLYVCLRPVQYFKGVPSPVKHPGEGRHGHLPREHRGHLRRHRMRRPARPRRKKVLEFLPRRIPEGVQEDPLRHRQTSLGIGIKPDLERTARRAPGPRRRSSTPSQQAQERDLVHKGNIMKFTEGAFRDWGYELAKSEFGAVGIDGGPWCKIPEGKPGAGIVIKDAIADITLQQVLTRPEEFDVIATLNLNGDYLSDALAAQVGGIGIAPGGNINYITGHAIFEATHGTAPKYADQDKVNPGSSFSRGEMMFALHGLDRSRRPDRQGHGQGHRPKDVTYDFARQMEGAKKIKCSEFATAVIGNMG